VFEAWFGSNTAFESQRDTHEIDCPVCGNNEVSKAIMAPNVGTKSNRKQPAARPLSEDDTTELGEFTEPVGLTSLPPKLQIELEHVLNKVRDHVETTCEYVGDDFPEEARKIHYGETPDRGIYGEATIEESEELLGEGIDIITLPITRKPRLSDS
jgi:hypothetical protein